MNPTKGSTLHRVNEDGTVQMRDLRSPGEQERGVVLTDEQKIQRLANHVVSLERVIHQITEDNNNIITGLHDEIATIRPYANFYHTMMKQIIENPTLMNEWQSFCLLLKMTDPDEDKYRNG